MFILESEKIENKIENKIEEKWDNIKKIDINLKIVRILILIIKKIKVIRI